MIQAEMAAAGKAKAAAYARRAPREGASAPHNVATASARYAAVRHSVQGVTASLYAHETLPRQRLLAAAHGAMTCRLMRIMRSVRCSPLLTPRRFVTQHVRFAARHVRAATSAAPRASRAATRRRRYATQMPQRDDVFIRTTPCRSTYVSPRRRYAQRSARENMRVARRWAKAGQAGVRVCSGVRSRRIVV